MDELKFYLESIARLRVAVEEQAFIVESPLTDASLYPHHCFLLSTYKQALKSRREEFAARLKGC